MLFNRNTDEAKIFHHGDHVKGFGSKQHDLHYKLKELIKDYYFEEPDVETPAFLGKAEGKKPKINNIYEFNSSFEK